MSEKPALLIHGMHGLGDNIHQRAVLRALMHDNSVTLTSSWASLYHDLMAEGLRVASQPIALRTQLKNAAREAARFNGGSGPPSHHPGRSMRISYGATHIRQTRSGTVLEAMFRSAGIPHKYAEADYRLPVPDEWSFRLFNEITKSWPNTGKPILVYRPLVVRPEWHSGEKRNANVNDYAEVFASIRDNFFVVSVADLMPGREWIIGPHLKADVELHKGELVFETLAALFKQAACVYTSSGFACILAPAVGTPCISIQGGYETAAWHSDGAKFAPYLDIDTMRPCGCGGACTMTCSKKLDVPKAIERVRTFVTAHCGISAFVETRPHAEMFVAAEPTPNLKPALVLKPAPILKPGFARRMGHPQLLARQQLLGSRGRAAGQGPGKV